MKKTIYFFTILLITLSSCSSDNDSSLNSKILINPPNWIQGKWLLEGGSAVGESGWSFTNNDFIIILANTEMSQRELFESLLNNGGEVSTSDVSTENSYSVTLNSPQGITVIYSFTKVSNTKITWDRISNSIYNKQ
ncbi:MULTISPECIES: hypothetical protein [unclassified Polaribacter]|uniref:hypothetical protein n=1 Tax=unclassified Polaribacter TaxID=196858 RepID=UPI0011BE1FE2|nr:MULTISPECIES: hypothetical protein [unclassified Polaribacter]TXD48160.1 hypothetical protein ES043_17940 [Polaribacter sp. IC063]TXD55642.1 hypothetical protein ES044_17870 [Polaribacter sp. IC066]